MFFFFFLPNSCPHTKFHPNRTKNIEVKKIGQRLALVGWSGKSKNSCMHFKLILFVFLAQCKPPAAPWMVLPFSLFPFHPSIPNPSLIVSSNSHPTLPYLLSLSSFIPHSRLMKNRMLLENSQLQIFSCCIYTIKYICCALVIDALI